MPDSIIIQSTDSLLAVEPFAATSLQPAANSQPVLLLEAKPLGTTPLGLDSSWILLVALSAVVLFGLIKVRSQEFFSTLFSSVTVDSNWRALRSNADLRYYWPLRLCSFAALCIFTLFAYEVFVAQGFMTFFGQKHFAAFSLLLACVFGFFLVRNIITYVVGYAFDCSGRVQDYLKAKTLSLSVYSVVALPFVLTFPFVATRFYFVFSVIAGVLALAGVLVRFVRSLQIISPDMVSLSYYILYLCGVEIAPILCLVKALSIGLNLAQ